MLSKKTSMMTTSDTQTDAHDDDDNEAINSKNQQQNTCILCLALSLYICMRERERAVTMSRGVVVDRSLSSISRVFTLKMLLHTFHFIFLYASVLSFILIFVFLMGSPFVHSFRSTFSPFPFDALFARFSILFINCCFCMQNTAKNLCHRFAFSSTNFAFVAFSCFVICVCLPVIQLGRFSRLHRIMFFAFRRSRVHCVVPLRLIQIVVAVGADVFVVLIVSIGCCRNCNFFPCSDIFRIVNFHVKTHFISYRITKN